MNQTAYPYSRHRATSLVEKRHHGRRIVMLLCIALVFVGIVVLPSIIKPQTIEAVGHESKSETALQASYDAQTKLLSEIPTQGLNSVQTRLLQLAKQQFATHATSYDATVMAYTQGAQESWCADFVSWLRNQAGVPFINQNSGSWRIPGVDTLQAYYQQYNAYDSVGNYTPKLGDVAFYTDTTLSGDNTAHVAMVLGVVGNNLITIGGNEGTGAGTIQVRSDPLQDDYLGLSGFGDSTL